jgi:PIN domain nuclease of toxin-antitoxin system
VRVLLDTHAFLWFVAGDRRLSAEARTSIESPETERLLSVAALWEMTIKASLDRLDIGLPMPEFVDQQVHGNGIEVLGVEPAHLESLRHLPYHHRDPFDRLMIAQAKTEGIQIVSKDGAFPPYGLHPIW